MFLNNKQFKEIMKAKKSGDDRARAIIEKMLGDGSQEELDGLVHEYYGEQNPTPEDGGPEIAVEQEAPAPTEAEVQAEDGDAYSEISSLIKDEWEAIEGYAKAAEALKGKYPAVAKMLLNIRQEETVHVGELQKIMESMGLGDVVPDLKEGAQEVCDADPEAECCEPHDCTEDIDREMDGLIDDIEVDDESFEDFLADKKKKHLRDHKGNGYFSVFDAGDREKYLADKKNAFSESFNLRRKDIDRNYRDMSQALDSYIGSLDLIPDDEIGLDTQAGDKAYEAIVDLGGKTHGVGRGWDNEDVESVKAQLNNLVNLHGKKNVLAALNMLKGDNEAYRTHRNNRIDMAVSDYGKSLDKFLK